MKQGTVPRFTEFKINKDGTINVKNIATNDKGDLLVQDTATSVTIDKVQLVLTLAAVVFVLFRRRRTGRN